MKVTKADGRDFYLFLAKPYDSFVHMPSSQPLAESAHIQPRKLISYHSSGQIPPSDGTFVIFLTQQASKLISPTKTNGKLLFNL